MSVQKTKQQVLDALQKKDFATAEAACRDAEGTIPEIDLLLMRGILCSAQDEKQKALTFLEKAFVADPKRADIAYNYGVVLHEMGYEEEALQMWLLATKGDPACLPAWQNAGVGLIAKGDWDQAACFYQEALTFHPTDRTLLFAYGTLCSDRNKIEEACRVFDLLTQNYPQDVDVWINAGRVFKTAGFFEKAEACYQKALSLGDLTRQALIAFNYSNLLLTQGRWQAGFTAYEARLKLPGAIQPPWNLPPWREDLPKGSHLLLWNDQGLGDAMMFLRFVPEIKARGYRLSLFVQSALKRLVSSVEGIEAVFDPTSAPQPMDAAVPLGSLPYLLKTKPETSWNGPYLFPSAEPVSFFGESDARLKIGLVWAGNPGHYNDRNRSMTLDDLAPLFSDTSIDWYSLQKGPKAGVPAPYQKQVQDLAPHLDDFATTAAVLKKLDFVLCVDTAIAHLAGALGVKAYVMLPALGGDWRWGASGTLSFWYPSLRLFRQSKAGDWRDVLSKIQEALKA